MEGSRWGMYRTGLQSTPVSLQCQVGVREEVRVIQESPWKFGGGPTQKKSKKSKSISGILGWVLTFFDPKF